MDNNESKCCWNLEDKGILERDVGWKLLNLKMASQKGRNLDQQRSLGTEDILCRGHGESESLWVDGHKTRLKQSVSLCLVSQMASG